MGIPGFLWKWSQAGSPPDSEQAEMFVDLGFAVSFGLLATGALYRGLRASHSGTPLALGTTILLGARSWPVILGTMIVAELQWSVLAAVGVFPAFWAINSWLGGGPWLVLAAPCALPGLLRLLSLTVAVPAALFSDESALASSARLCSGSRWSLALIVLPYQAIGWGSLGLGSFIQSVSGLDGVALDRATAIVEAAVGTPVELLWVTFTLVAWEEFVRLERARLARTPPPPG
jgi:hypothetical protein